MDKIKDWKKREKEFNRLLKKMINNGEVKFRHNRPVITPEMMKKLPCPFEPWAEK